jgi:hypothetical protein
MGGLTNDKLGYLTAFVSAVLALAVLFGVDLSGDQIAGILLVISTGGALAFGLNTAVGKPAEIRAAARKQGVDV